MDRLGKGSKRFLKPDRENFVSSVRTRNNNAGKHSDIYRPTRGVRCCERHGDTDDIWTRIGGRWREE